MLAVIFDKLLSGAALQTTMFSGAFGSNPPGLLQLALHASSIDLD